MRALIHRRCFHCGIRRRHRRLAHGGIASLLPSLDNDREGARRPLDPSGLHGRENLPNPARLSKVGTLKSILVLVAATLTLTACGSEGGDPAVATIEPAPTIVHLTVDVRDTVQHDSDAFTQGLVFVAGALYESTGKYGRSELRQVEPDSGDVLRSTSLDADLFGEGLAHVDDRLIQLTWKAGRALVYDRARLSVIDEFAYDGEGWGLCFDGTRLVMSNGSSTLTFRDPDSFDVIGNVEVTHDGAPVTLLNELECVDRAVYANVWRTDQIVRIDPSTGRVDAVIEAGSLDRSPSAGELNGIAHDPATGWFRLTGKNWSTAYDVEFAEDG